MITDGTLVNYPTKISQISKDRFTAIVYHINTHLIEHKKI